MDNLRISLRTLLASALLAGLASAAWAAPYQASFSVYGMEDDGMGGFTPGTPTVDAISGSFTTGGGAPRSTADVIANGFGFNASAFNLFTDRTGLSDVVTTGPPTAILTRFQLGTDPNFTNPAPNTAGSFAGGTGLMGLNGAARAFVWVDTGVFGITTSFTLPVPLTGVLGVGGATTVTVANTGFAPDVTAVVSGANWRTGMAVAQTGPTTAPVNVTTTGSDWHTVTTTGGAQFQQISLVTPVQVTATQTSLLGSSTSLQAFFGRLDISMSMVPEPSTLLLASAGVVGLVLLGRRRGA